MIPGKESLKTIPYTCSGQTRKPQFGYKTNHFKYTFDKARCNIQVIENLQYGKFLQGEKNVQGDAVYLPWEEDHITSIRLQAPLQAGIGAQFFYTANMHGCKFYVDTIKGSNDVIVYHANAKREDPGGAGRAPNSQLPACVQKLDELHRNAQRDYGNIIQKNIISFGKQDYFRDANPLIDLKRVRALPIGVRKRRVEWSGKCFVCGYPSGGKWRFYYQTHGEIWYERPSGAGNVLLGVITGHWKYLHKLRTQGKTGIARPYGVISSGEIPIIA
ncbi:MAG: hypothetical protein KQH63_12195 [Desulfobulbaceae bacterium]|nr:hypothetical protein [Desulfobulbaceae bacterium]